MIDTKKIRELCDAIDSDQTVLDAAGCAVNFTQFRGIYDSFKIKELAPTIELCGRIYDLRPLPEKKKPREWRLHNFRHEWLNALEALPASANCGILVREVLEDDNGK